MPTIGVWSAKAKRCGLSLSVNVFEVLDMYVARHGHYRCLIAKLARAGIITALLYTIHTADNGNKRTVHKSTIVVFLFLSYLFLDTLTVYHPRIIVVKIALQLLSHD